MTTFTHFGKPTSRIDGRAKVTGAAKYAGEYNVPGLAHGFVVSSAIAKGRIKRIDFEETMAVDGVIAVLTHANRPSLPPRTRPTTTKSRRPARRSVRSMTTRFASAGSRSHSWSRRNSRSRGLPLRWCASNMTRSRTSRTSTRNARAPRRRQRTSIHRTPVARQRRRSSARRCGSRPNTEWLSSITIRWSRSQRPRCGATTASPSTTRPKAR